MLTNEQMRGKGILGIQGDSGIGKSTMALDLGRMLEVPVFETSGAFRGFTAWALNQDVDFEDESALADMAREFDFSVEDSRVIVSGMDVTDDLRSAAVDRLVHVVARVQAVRDAYIAAMNEWVDVRPAIVVGRHLREVWPQARLIIEVVRTDGVTHEAGARAGTHAAEHLERRSLQDRETGARISRDPSLANHVELDTTGMNVVEQAAAALELARAHGF